jgi:hypothetical protein
MAGSLRLNRGMRATGRVGVTGAAIGGDLDLVDGHVAGDGDLALIANRAHVGGGVFLSRGFTAEGEVRMVGSTVDGNLQCTDGSLTNPGRIALNVGGAQVRGSAYLDRGFVADGEVRLPGATVGGVLVFDGASVLNPGGVAIAADNAAVSGLLSMAEGFEAEGEVRLQAVDLRGNLDLHGARLENPGGNALDADGARVAGAAFLDRGFVADGTVTARGGSFASLSCKGGTFTAPGEPGPPDGPAGVAIALDGAVVAGTLFLHGGMRASGRVSLLNASATAVRDDRSSWPDEVELDGFQYEKLDCPPEDRGWRARRDWLRRQRTPSTQGYTRLAAVYRAAASPPPRG